MNEFWQWFDNYVSPRIKDERSFSFRKMFEYLDKFNNPVILETGCVNAPDDNGDLCWSGHGCSTILFDKYVSLNGGHFYSVDSDYTNVLYASKMVGKNSHIYHNDSITFLKNFIEEDLCQSPLNLIYLDSGTWQWPATLATQIHHFNELMILMPKVSRDTLVVTDDSPCSLDEMENWVIEGRGGIISQYANERDIKLVFSGYQAGWIGFPGVISPLPSNKELLLKARKLIEDEKWSEAYYFYRKVYMLASARSNDKENEVYSEACTYFARVAAYHKRYGTSYDWYNKALEANPLANNYRLELIIRAMKPLGWLTMARIEALRAVEIDPKDPVAWCTLAEIEQDLGNMSSSLAAYDKFIETSDKSTFSLLTKATFLVKTEEYGEAETLCDVIISRNESLGDTFACKAMILTNYGDYEGAIDLFKKALGYDHKDHSMIKYFLSLALFSIGRHREGWQNLFAARIDNESFGPLYGAMRRFAKDKKQLFVMQSPPARIHIHPDAGEGDNLAMMRYLPLLVSKGYTVRYEARNGAFKLAQDSFPGVEVVPLADDFPGTSGLPEFDYQLPIVDLPFVFQTEIDTIPWTGPYIKADPELVEKYKLYKDKIGIVWSTGTVNWSSGNKNQSYAHNKSIKFDLLNPIIDIDPSLFVSLQAGPVRADNNRISEPLPYDQRSLTWAETAALVENLSLVIAIDTSVAHLAGAMGKPTWLMMHKYLTSWQFMAEYKDASWNTASPWYPTMRIFRQKERGDWGSVITTIADELRNR